MTRMRTRDTASPLSIRLRFSEETRLGPGKIALLEAVARTGSIAAAGRELGMSYRRAWLLIDSMNRCFDEPVITAASGGAQGGGADITPLGHQLIRAFRALEADAQRAVDGHFAALYPHMRSER
ncbi:MAG: molybdenum-pterin-binding protein MopA [Pseudomonadota bacterium]|jgi:molybdate transport system regulatory protein